MAPQAVLWFLRSSVLVIITFHRGVVLPAAAAPISSMTTLSTPPGPGCSEWCGDVHIPYPFGIGERCAAAWPDMVGFDITCNRSFTPPKPFLGDFEILNITVETGEVRVVSRVSYICYDSYNTVERDRADWSIQLPSSFLISKRRNTFTAIGCDTLAFLGGMEERSFLTGCISSCESLGDAAQDNDECAGLGCCQMGIPGNRHTIAIQWGNTTGIVNSAWNYSPCSYAFVAEKDWYHFRREDLTRVGNKSFTSRVSTTIPVVFDWAIKSDGACQISLEASGKTTSACASAHSECVKATQGNGYLCNCSTGYQGNPYVVDGCTNIDECELRKSNPTRYEKLYPCYSGSTCQDIPGGYNCKCKFWHRRDGKNEKGCQPIVPGYAVAIVATFVSAVLACFGIVLLQRRKHRKHFSKNGGDILKKMGINIFTKRKLNKITNSYKQNIGQGCFGQVYKGTIEGTQHVAVKRSHGKGLKGEKVHLEEFTNEIIFQFQVRHDNLVRLVGCCLETDVPILVFEYISRGSLQDALHGGAGRPPCALSLMERLDIAIGSAKALAYMHSHGERSHVHGDVKPANILLDGDLKPKVSDFGSSKLLSVNSYAKYVAADGTYIDPVYYKTCLFTVKSDVYSFGVVVLELITRRKARYGDSSLTIDFKNCWKAHGNGREMYDAEILCVDDAESQCYKVCLDMVSALAIRCLKEDAEDRPTMGEVVEELVQAKSVASRGSCKEAS